MNDRLRSLGDLNRVIHEPARLMIVATLSFVERADFVYLQTQTALTKGNLSSHLMRLEETGYVTIDKSFRGKVPVTTCALSKAGRAAFKEYQAALKHALR